MGTPVKIGVIGLGHIARDQMKALAKVEQYEIAAVCDSDRNKEKQFHLEVPFYDDYQDLLAENLDAVLISTPNLTHYEICKYALLKGKHVLLEKPAVPSTELLRKLKHISEEQNVIFSIAYHASFAKDLLWFLEEYKTNGIEKFGPITGFHCKFYDPYLINGDLQTHAISLQGSWIDSGINALSVLEKLLPIQHVHIVDSRLSEIKGIPCKEVQGSVDFTFPIQGTRKIGRGQIDTNWTLGKNSKQTILYFDDTNQSIILEHSKQQVIKVDPDQTTSVLQDFSNENTRLVNHYDGVFNEFYNHLSNGTNNLPMSLRLHRLLYAPYSLT
ncbi:Gfo/Idh/MocA family oxidoreductase [Virgibacillus sp. C22-A2]|uniref:Gfo/Idh/MocA family oxidoreductase n=1 Tax=Virgibacillus tibetensis TaxID=3042313 RepID=A0ABU6KDU8_9BACI|nr:Gfo/Idh/MocA family oxidoreductase [Virgibacillus sp. C22-A2]